MINYIKNYIEKRKQKRSLDSLKKQIYVDTSQTIDDSTLKNSNSIISSIKKEKNILKKIFNKKRKADLDRLESLNKIDYN